ncbi:HupE/UreJ family protein [Aliiglaciecola lipolytica]|uniref:HupE/UreJ family protein n=1 Tax=Aliiglaciecola lipolytica E3 TaxID=1127673 RepID=K6YCT6_9ALTE|nr:HupE/UreJ family protein [Aliiglaciecola lipolytica]GAC16007.1 hypothetical protein GLIP_3393 [Aliiglaciecola lipolytica E3]
MKRVLTILFICFIVCFSLLPAAHGHQLSTGYLSLNVSESQSNKLDGQLQVRLFDLERSVGLDKNLDGQLLWREVTERQAQIEAYLLSQFIISSGQNPCAISISPTLQTDMHFDEGYLVANLQAECKGDISQQPLAIQYSAVFSEDADHKLLVNVTGFGQSTSELISGVIDLDSQRLEFAANQSHAFDTFVTYVYQGIVHIFIGLDHILFLVVLMMSCVLYRDDGKWHSRPKLSGVLKSAAWIVTAFTLAHSITLTATAMNWISPSSRWVEFGIAISVLLTALNNLKPIIIKLGWITFGFGLIHGMGFASVLSELGLSAQHQVLSILAFNLGVELGQLAILGIVIPLFFVCRHYQLYRLLVLKFGSLAIGLIALNWAIQRF